MTACSNARVLTRTSAVVTACGTVRARHAHARASRPHLAATRWHAHHPRSLIHLTCLPSWPSLLLPLPLPQGKLETEDLLRRSGVNFTSIRPVYIYGPLNYNPVEEYFFHRLKAGRPIVVPGSGMQVRRSSAAQRAGVLVLLWAASPLSVCWCVLSLLLFLSPPSFSLSHTL